MARESDKKEMPPIIFVNSQGAVGYHATDVATIVDRKRELDPDRILYVVDARQRLHFEQVFRAVERAGYYAEDRLEHLWFGTMNGKDGKPFKTRAGGTLKLRHFLKVWKAYWRLVWVWSRLSWVEIHKLWLTDLQLGNELTHLQPPIAEMDIARDNIPSKTKDTL